MAVPVPKTWVAFETVDAPEANAEWRDILNYLLAPAADADVNVSETTTSTSYVDLATSGPAVTVTITNGQPVAVTVSAFLHISSTANIARMSYAVSGAETDNTQSVMDLDAISSSNTDDSTLSRTTIYVPGTAGSHTFTAKYRVNGGTGTFTQRRIVVDPA
jgi:hypothetical protein